MVLPWWQRSEVPFFSAGGAPYARNTPYVPLVELLKSFCHIQDVDTPSEVRERVARALPAAADPQSVQPPILDLLGVLPLDDAFHKVDPIQRRRRIHDGVRQMLWDRLHSWRGADQQTEARSVDSDGSVVNSWHAYPQIGNSSPSANHGMDAPIELTFGTVLSFSCQR